MFKKICGFSYPLLSNRCKGSAKVQRSKVFWLFTFWRHPVTNQHFSLVWKSVCLILTCVDRAYQGCSESTGTRSTNTIRSVGVCVFDQWFVCFSLEEMMVLVESKECVNISAFRIHCIWPDPLQSLLRIRMHFDFFSRIRIHLRKHWFGSGLHQNYLEYKVKLNIFVIWEMHLQNLAVTKKIRIWIPC